MSEILGARRAGTEFLCRRAQAPARMGVFWRPSKGRRTSLESQAGNQSDRGMYKEVATTEWQL